MLFDKLTWRYATKKMDPTRAVPQDKVDRIIEAIRMAPTSSGTQPFELFVATNPGLRAELCKAANGQAQITDGSHVLVFAAWHDYTAARLDAVLSRTQQERGANEGMTRYYERLKSMYLPRDAQTNHDHAARQAYIALGFALAAAAELEVDSTPMEGFDADRVDQILGLEEKGLHSVLLLPLGYRAEGEDWLLPMKKIRKSHDEMVTFLD